MLGSTSQAFGGKLPMPVEISGTGGLLSLDKKTKRISFDPTLYAALADMASKRLKR